MANRLVIVLLSALILRATTFDVCAAVPPRKNQPEGPALAVSAPRPEYPHEARRRGMVGSGIATIEVDIASGEVTSARMSPSTGHALLDQAALEAFRKWRFKPGSVSQVRTPITFTTGGRVITEVKVKQKSMDDVLARFLRKGTVLKGPIPAYPRIPAWDFKEGKGVYELHVGKDGRVGDVKILKPSGDATFDRACWELCANGAFAEDHLFANCP